MSKTYLKAKYLISKMQIIVKKISNIVDLELLS
jgi:hypothetical protein